MKIERRGKQENKEEGSEGIKEEKGRTRKGSEPGNIKGERGQARGE